MSQMQAIAAPGAIIPAIETVTGGTGGAVAIDALNNVNLLTDSFLSTTGNPATHTITISQLGKTSATGSTIGAVTSNITSVSLGAVPDTYVLEAKVCGFEATGPNAAGFTITCVARTSGAAATIIGVQGQYKAQDAAVLTSDAVFLAVGNTIVVQVTGVVGLTINWGVVTSYTKAV